MIDDDRLYLHTRGRADHLDTLDEHLWQASALARALWLIVDNPDTNTGDPRDRLAVKALASAVADHASAAEFLVARRSSSDAAGASARGASDG